MIRPNGLFLPLALLLAILATAFGAMAVSSGHHHASASDHGELVPHRAEHEGDEAADVASGVGDGLAALALSILAVGLVPIGVRTTRSADPPDALRFTVAVASAGAAAVHFAVIDQHVAEWWLFGVFFVVVALAQLGWAIAVVSSPTRALYFVGALGNALVAMTWAVSRTIGLPFGPGADEPEPIGIPDVVSTAFELVIVLGTVLLLRGLVVPGPRATRIVGPLVALAAMAITALALMTL